MGQSTTTSNQPMPMSRMAQPYANDISAAATPQGMTLPGMQNSTGGGMETPTGVQPAFTGGVQPTGGGDFNPMRPPGGYSPMGGAGGPPPMGSTSMGGGGMGMAGMPFQTAIGQIGSNGLTPQMQGAIGNLQGIASGQNGINTGGLYGNLFNQSQTINANPNSVMSWYANNNPITTAGGYGDIAARARNANAGAIGTASGIAGGQNGITAGNSLQGLYNSTTGQNNDALGWMSGIAGGQNGINTGGQFQNVSESAAGPTASQQYLTSMAQGGGTNPFLQQMLDSQAARISNRMNSAMSGSGRYGSFGHSDALARSISDASNPLLAQAYESDQNRRLSAASQIDASRRAADATRLQGIQGQTGVQGTNIGNQLGAAQSLGNLRNANTSLGAGLLGQIGQFQGQNIGNQLNAANLWGNLNQSGFGTELGALGGQTGAQGQGANINLSAAGNLANSNRNDIGGALSALGGLTGTQQQNIANRMGATGNILDALNSGANRSLSWAGLTPQLNNLAYDPMQRMMGVGGYLQGRDQTDLDAQRAAFEQANNMPWAQLGRYGAATNPILQGLLNSATGGTKTTETPFNLMNYLGLFQGGGNSAVTGAGNAAGSLLGFLKNPFG